MPLLLFAHLGIHHHTKLEAALHQLQGSVGGLMVTLVLAVVMMLALSWLINKAVLIKPQSIHRSREHEESKDD